MRITAKDQGIMPADIREQAGLQPQAEEKLGVNGNAVFAVPANTGKRANRGARVVAHLRGKGDVALSTDAIMALTRKL